MDGVALFTVFVLAIFVGYEVISKVSSTLHTPLMSGSNAISGIILVGTVVVAAHTESDVIFALELVAVALAAVNLVGGFLVTDRMLQMFRRTASGARSPRHDRHLDLAGLSAGRRVLHHRAQRTLLTQIGSSR